MTEPAIKNVSDTAFMVAVFRAMETRRARPLFRDPWAERLAGEHGTRIVSALPKEAFLGGWTVVIRTCVIDGLIQSAIEQGIDTIVNLGAGLDTRPYRLELPASLRWMEVDYPHVIELKETRLAEEEPKCQLKRVSLDLADDQRRQAFLRESAASSSRILVLTEGVTPYLEPEAVAILGRELRSHASYAGWITDYFSPLTYKYRRRRRGLSQAMKNAPLKFEPLDYFGFFAEVGWQPRETRYLPEEGARLGRPFPLPAVAKLWLTLLRPFLSEERRAAFRKLMGYVWFVPA